MYKNEIFNFVRYFLLALDRLRYLSFFVESYTSTLVANFLTLVTFGIIVVQFWSWHLKHIFGQLLGFIVCFTFYISSICISMDKKHFATQIIQTNFELIVQKWNGSMDEFEATYLCCLGHISCLNDEKECSPMLYVSDAVDRYEQGVLLAEIIVMLTLVFLSMRIVANSDQNPPQIATISLPLNTMQTPARTVGEKQHKQSDRNETNESTVRRVAPDACNPIREQCDWFKREPESAHAAHNSTSEDDYDHDSSDKSCCSKLTVMTSRGMSKSKLDRNFESDTSGSNSSQSTLNKLESLPLDATEPDRFYRQLQKYHMSLKKTKSNDLELEKKNSRQSDNSTRSV